MSNYKTTTKKHFLSLLPFLLLFCSPVFAQEYSNESLKFGIGFGINEGNQEIGVGTIVSFGYQKSIWNDRVRINPNIMTGNFRPFGITDTRDQYYRITTFGMNGYLDLIKYNELKFNFWFA
ncbi:MAG: hypothetical protein L3J11_00635 [Draconibacterium sp.]|nr:hypothetical protein [Draconibacterium sp.]